MNEQLVSVVLNSELSWAGSWRLSLAPRRSPLPVQRQDRRAWRAVTRGFMGCNGGGGEHVPPVSNFISKLPYHKTSGWSAVTAQAENPPGEKTTRPKVLVEKSHISQSKLGGNHPQPNQSSHAHCYWSLLWSAAYLFFPLGMFPLELLTTL